MSSLGVPAGASFAAAARASLDDLRRRVGMEAWWLTRRRGDEQVVLAAVDGGQDQHPLPVRPWEGTVCAAMLAGRGPRAAPRAADVPAYAHVVDGSGAALGAVLSVPVPSASGAVLGTICATDPGEQADLESHLPTVQVQARLLGALLEHELRRAEQQRGVEGVGRARHVDAESGLLDADGWRAALEAEQGRADALATRAAVVVVDLEPDPAADLDRPDGLPARRDPGRARPRRVRTVARLLEQAFGPDAVLARLGADRLAVLLAGTLPAPLPDLVGRLRASLAAAGVSAALGAGERRGTEGLDRAWERAGSAALRGPPPGPAVLPRVTAGAPASRPSVPRSGPVGTVDAVLTLVRRQLRADAAFVSVFEGEARRLRNLVSVVPLPPGVEIGTTEATAGTHCGLLVAGRLDPVVPDLAADPRTRDLPSTRALGVGSYVGVPLHRRDGRLYGTLCTVSLAPDPTLRQRDADVLRAVADAVMDLVDADERAEQARSVVLDRLADLRARGGLHVVHQPVVALADLREVGAEALSRFPAGTPGPAWWFAQAAAAGVGEVLETDAVRAGLALLDERAGGIGPAVPAPRYVALNCSAATLVSGAFARCLVDRPLDRVVVEVTEHERVEDYDALRSALAPLRARGLRVAVDDAGAGFSTMRHVLALLPDLIKLDISLVAGIDADPARRALAAALTTFASGTGAEIVAEGVQTGAELVCLRELGVGYGQGRLLGSPR